MSRQRRFPNIASSVTEARHFVAQELSKLPIETVESATVLVSELATICARRAHTGFTVTVELSNSTVRVEVIGDDSGRTVPSETRPLAPSGMSRQILESLSSGWGVAELGTFPGTRMWFTLPISLSSMT